MRESDKKEFFDRLERYIRENLSKKRQRHTDGVMKAAEALTQRYIPEDQDPEEFHEKVKTAVLFHDIYRGVPVDEINRKLDEFGIASIGGHVYRDDPSLAHGKLAAVTMVTEWGVTDRDIINAVSFHTTGRAHMSTLEKIVFLADAIEENRDYPGLDEIRKAARESLDKGCLASLRNTVSFLECNGRGREGIDRDTLEAIEYFEGEEKRIG